MMQFNLVPDPDAGSVRRLFEASFGTPMDPLWQHWKYSLMGGFGLGLSLNSGELIAFYAGFPRQLIEPCADFTNHRDQTGSNGSHVLQIGDVMVHPRHRAYFSRRGPFALVARAFIEHHVGLHVAKPDRMFRWIFGFPNDRHLRIGERLDMYRPVDAMQELSFDLDRGFQHNRDPAPDVRLTQLTVALATASMGDLIDEWVSQYLTPWVQAERLWMTCRGASWWKRRYLAWPAYRCYMVHSPSPSPSPSPSLSLSLGASNMVDRRDLTSLIGIFAVRTHQQDGASHLELLDLVARPDAWPTVLESIVHLARAERVNQLRAWASARTAEWLAEQAKAAQLEMHRSMLPFKLAAGAWAAELLQRRVWSLGGDTDFR